MLCELGADGRPPGSQRAKGRDGVPPLQGALVGPVLVVH